MPSSHVEPLSDDSNSLSDSAYEIISSVDGESQDGRHTDSLADSLEIYPQGDDVRSLGANTPTHEDDTESEYDEEAATEEEDDEVDEEEEAAAEQSRADSIRYAESSLQNPSAFEDITLNNSGEHIVNSIEFVEDEDTAHHDAVIGKHAVKEYSEKETAEIAETLNIVDPPKQLIASIWQVMSTHLLSVHEPLRILYVGSDAARTEIMHKISSAILASGSDRHPRVMQRNSDGTFNIVPISSFGSDKVPDADEIQLMGVSDYYINVSRCVHAEETLRDTSSDPSDAIYSITTESGQTYASNGNLFLPGGVIEPEWTLPHLAIFYLSGNDDEEAEKTTHAAWEFMTRHGVPSLFITHTILQPTLKSWRWQKFIDQGAVHMVLESRGQNGDDASVVRCPIDLASFMSIDARQMNRNLAYLTGNFAKPSDIGDATKRALSRKLEAMETLLRSSQAGAVTQLKLMAQETRQALAALEAPEARKSLKGYIHHAYDLSRYFNHIPLLVMSLLVYALVHLLALGGLTTAGRGMDINMEIITTQPHTCAVPTMVPTVTINVVSTKTVHLGVDETTHIFGGFLSDKAASTVPQPDPEPKKVSCSIEIYSDNEILVKIPSKRAKSAWLAAGAIDIDVWRGKELLKSKLFSTDDGIMIEIPKKDAHGVMNVSVVARKPKINETFAINFGRSVFSEAYEAGTTMLHDAMHKFFETSEEAFKPVGEAFKGFDDTFTDAFEAWSVHIKETRKAAQEAYNNARSEKLSEKLSETMQESRARILRAREEVVDGTLLKLRRAQVVSKLWWLKAKGDEAEHKRYEKKAREFMEELERTAKLKGEVFEEALRSSDRRMKAKERRFAAWRQRWA